MDKYDDEHNYDSPYRPFTWAFIWTLMLAGCIAWFWLVVEALVWMDKAFLKFFP